MPRMDGTGPDKSGKQTGRGIGECKKISDPETIKKLGTDMGLRRKSGGRQGKRLKSGLK